MARSARKHGVSDEDIRHAVRTAIRVIPVGEMEMHIGADRSGRYRFLR